MTITKATWATDGDNLSFAVPFSKVDKERRIVSGFATLDNMDKQNDIVTTDASLKAFSKFRGNIREMHQPSAVGKMVDFKEDKYFDVDTKKFYSGVYVSAYVSKGAQDAWEKVLDGTYTGFSIGGKMNKWDDAYDEKSDATVRVIKDYDLVELSLVDNPANQFASIMAIEKNAEGQNVITGEVAETTLENVFWDKDSGIVILSEKDSEVSPVSGFQMENIGFVEKSDDEKTEMIKFLVDSAKGIDTKINKEVSPMTENTEAVTEEVAVEKSEEVAPEADATIETEKSEEIVDVEKSEEAETAEKAEDMDEEKMENGEEDEEMKGYKDKEKSETVSETETAVEKSDESEVSKSDEVAAQVADIKDSLATAFSDLSTVVKSLNEEIAELKKSLGDATTSLNEQIDSVKKDVASAQESFDEFGKRVDAVEADTAFRKSGDLGEIVQEVQMEKSEQSLWGGRFLKTADLFK
jgi:hypothetical protein